MARNFVTEKLQAFAADVDRQCAFFGVAYRLTDREIARLCGWGFSVDMAYSVASDVSCGFTFREACEASLLA